ncbi:MAG: phosphatase PAP2 family protein [Chitinophagales bacterium]
MKKTIFLACILGLFSFFISAPAIQGQSIHPLEPIQGNYKRLALLNASPGAQRAWMDTISFPWTEYSKNSLANSLWRTVYLKPDDEAKLPDLIKYPANSSDQTRAELDYLLELQNKRTKQEIDRAAYIANFGSWPNIINPTDSDFNENRRELFYVATPVIGEWYNYQNFPATTELLMNCIQDIRVTEFRLKRYFKRSRPYHLEPRLKPLARINSPSFASGHSLWSFTEALIFSEIIPEKRDGFLKMAEEVRRSRELMGIHYPSDNEASRIIAWHLLSYWYNNPQFVADIEKAKVEWQLKKR